MPDENLKKDKATTVTFLAGSRDQMRVDRGLNDTVQVKVADATCLQYVQVFANYLLRACMHHTRLPPCVVTPVQMTDGVQLLHLTRLQTYAPLFDCRSQCHQLLSGDCLFMLSQECSELCMGVHTETCASKALYQMATGKSSASALCSSWLLASFLALVLLGTSLTRSLPISP